MGVIGDKEDASALPLPPEADGNQATRKDEEIEPTEKFDNFERAPSVTGEEVLAPEMKDKSTDLGGLDALKPEEDVKSGKDKVHLETKGTVLKDGNAIFNEVPDDINDMATSCKIDKFQSPDCISNGEGGFGAMLPKEGAKTDNLNCGIPDADLKTEEIDAHVVLPPADSIEFVNPAINCGGAMPPDENEKIGKEPTLPEAGGTKASKPRRRRPKRPPPFIGPQRPIMPEDLEDIMNGVYDLVFDTLDTDDEAPEFSSSNESYSDSSDPEGWLVDSSGGSDSGGDLASDGDIENLRLSKANLGETVGAQGQLEDKIGFLDAEAKVTLLDVSVRETVREKEPLLPAGPEALSALSALSVAPLQPLSLIKHTHLLETAARLCSYVPPRRVDRTTRAARAKGAAANVNGDKTEPSGKVCAAAEVVLCRMMALLQMPEGVSLWDGVVDKVEIFAEQTQHMSIDQVFLLTEDPAVSKANKPRNRNIAVMAADQSLDQNGRLKSDLALDQKNIANQEKENSLNLQMDTWSPSPAGFQDDGRSVDMQAQDIGLKFGPESHQVASASATVISSADVSFGMKSSQGGPVDRENSAIQTTPENDLSQVNNYTPPKHSESSGDCHQLSGNLTDQSLTDSGVGTSLTDSGVGTSLTDSGVGTSLEERRGDDNEEDFSEGNISCERKSMMKMDHINIHTVPLFVSPFINRKLATESVPSNKLLEAELEAHNKKEQDVKNLELGPSVSQINAERKEKAVPMPDFVAPFTNRKVTAGSLFDSTLAFHTQSEFKQDEPNKNQTLHNAVMPLGCINDISNEDCRLLLDSDDSNPFSEGDLLEPGLDVTKIGGDVSLISELGLSCTTGGLQITETELSEQRATELDEDERRDCLRKELLSQHTMSPSSNFFSDERLLEWADSN